MKVLRLETKKAIRRVARFDDDCDHISMVVSESGDVIRHDAEFRTDNAVAILYNLAKVMADAMGANVTANDLLEKAHKFSKRNELIDKLSAKMLKNCK